MPLPDVHPLPGREILLSRDPRPDSPAPRQDSPATRQGGTAPRLGGTAAEGPATVRLHVVEHGRQQDGRLPLLMLHGVPATSYLWRDVARDLERDRLCLMPDLLGCGESERPPGRRAYRLEEQASLLLRMMEQLGIDRFAVLGNDLGGAVAVHLAAAASTAASPGAG